MRVTGKGGETHGQREGHKGNGHKVQRYALQGGLIRVATNICRDMIRFRIRHPKVSIDEVENTLAAPEQKEILRELLELPARQKTVIYLHYVEGYRVKEIADILGITESAVKVRLFRGRKRMRDMVSMEGGI